MTSQEFVQWLKGFTDGVHEYNITPKQWDLLKEKLTEVSDEPKLQFPFGTPNTVPYTPSFPPYVDPYNPYKVTCDDNYPGVIAADRVKYGTDTNYRTSGYIVNTDKPIISSGTITVSTGSGGFLYTSTDSVDIRTMMQSGSWHYTTSNDKTLLND